MVYARISIDGSDLHTIRNVALTGGRYRNKILRLTVVSYAVAIKDNF